MSKKKNNRDAETKLLPLSDTLHDLAVLRASDVDLATFLPTGGLASLSSDQDAKSTSPGDATASLLGSSAAAVPSTAPDDSSANDTKSDLASRDRLVEKSYEYVREGRAVIRLLHRGEVDTQGARVDGLRGELEEVLHGLDAYDIEDPSRNSAKIKVNSG